jgi:indole-3-glycerol phosphate synthase
MTSRRFSQAISEGDGISVIVPVGDLESARTAEEQRAEALIVWNSVPGLREAVSLPLLWRAEGPLEAARDGGADACLLIIEQLGDEEGALESKQAESAELGLEIVVDVKSPRELELALERIDPELFLLSPRDAEEGQAAHERVLELLTDVPAGKLAIADLAGVVRAEVDELERAGVDAVVVAAGNVTELVGTAPPEV